MAEFTFGPSIYKEMNEKIKELQLAHMFEAREQVFENGHMTTFHWIQAEDPEYKLVAFENVYPGKIEKFGGMEKFILARVKMNESSIKSNLEARERLIKERLLKDK